VAPSTSGSFLRAFRLGHVRHRHVRGRRVGGAPARTTLSTAGSDINTRLAFGETAAEATGEMLIGAYAAKTESAGMTEVGKAELLACEDSPPLQLLGMPKHFVKTVPS